MLFLFYDCLAKHSSFGKDDYSVTSSAVEMHLCFDCQPDKVILTGAQHDKVPKSKNHVYFTFKKDYSGSSNSVSHSFPELRDFSFTFKKDSSLRLMCFRVIISLSSLVEESLGLIVSPILGIKG